MSSSQQEKGEAFRALHEGEPFVIPNPWDAGSAKILAGLGFKALATTSSGFDRLDWTTTKLTTARLLIPLLSTASM